jgi:magnesium chelatase subunit I
MPRVQVSEKILQKIAQVAIEIGVDGHRADLVMMKAAKTMAAYHGRDVVSEEDVLESAELALYHRVRRKPFEDVLLDMDQVSAVMRGKPMAPAASKQRQ